MQQERSGESNQAPAPPAADEHSRDHTGQLATAAQKGNEPGDQRRSQDAKRHAREVTVALDYDIDKGDFEALHRTEIAGAEQTEPGVNRVDKKTICQPRPGLAAAAYPGYHLPKSE